MIRIIFKNGELLDCDNIEKIFIEEFDHDSKVVIVGKILPMNVSRSPFKPLGVEEDLVIDTEGGY